MTETNLNNKIISQHIFMFPFRLKNQYTLEKLKRKVSKDGWEYKPFDFKFGDADAAAKYNEYAYFHEYARQAIFNKGDSNDDYISLYLERAIPNNATFNLYIKKGKTYTLPISHISLRLFDTDVGILTIELLNYDYPSFEDVLIINDFGRRIYPQFIGEKEGTGETKDAFLPDKIEFNLGEKSIRDDFKTEDYLRKELRLASYINYLLGNELKDEVIPVIDDRMFTVCWYGNNKISKDLSSKKQDEYVFESSDEWYKFIYVDGKNIGVANEKMKRDLIRSATYSRWADYRALFGISRYSLVSITEGKDFGYGVIRIHMESLYYQMAIILLAQRASILRFSNDISKISSGAKVSEDIVEQVEKLYSSFIRFTSRLSFTEISPQEQGIEMYNMAVKNMGLREQLNELRYEIERLYEFVDVLHEKSISKGLRIIRIISFLFIGPVLAATLINTGVFSANIKVPIFGYNIQNGWLFIILTVLILIILWFLYEIGLKRRR